MSLPIVAGGADAKRLDVVVKFRCQCAFALSVPSKSGVVALPPFIGTFPVAVVVPVLGSS